MTTEIGWLDPQRTSISTLAAAIEAVAQADGDYLTSVPGLTLHRRHPATGPAHCIYGLGLGITAQGRKQVSFGDEVICLEPGQSVLTTAELPVTSHVLGSSESEPVLGVMLALDLWDVAQMAFELELSAPSPDCACRPITVAPLDSDLLEAVVRFIALLDEPDLLPHLAPLIQREIIYRLLMGPHSAQLMRLLSTPRRHEKLGFERTPQFEFEYRRQFCLLHSPDTEHLRMH
ncbi:AraC family transcriptional regulator [Pseudomonas aeruginosa]|nr:AraC family transcriptional regulator [Pseudomonas aeruginosa]